MTKKKPLGQLATLSFELEEPVKMSFSMTDIRQLMILVGQNGTGKTFMLMNSFALSYLINMVIMSDNKLNQVEAAQFVYDHCCDSPIDGRVESTHTCGVSARVIFEKGKVTEVSVVNWEDKEPVQVKYLSSGMRLFNDIKMYLKIRKRIESDDFSITPEQRMAELLKDFKLYDVTYLESMIMKCPLTIPSHILETLKENYDVKDEIVTFDVDISKDDFFFTMKDGSRKYLCSYGAGHQALFNMLIANC